MRKIELPCGGTAYFDVDSGCAHRCYNCGAVVGSIGMPKACKDKIEARKSWEVIGGKAWDYYGDNKNAMD